MDAQPSSPAVRTSRPSFIDGELEIIKYAQFLATEYPKALRKAIKQAVKEEQSALQEAASNDGDWNQLANNMSVRYNTETADVVYGVTTGKQAMQKATDLEYGVPQQNAPRPLLRSFAKSREHDFGKRVEELVEMELRNKYR
jgi:hypothetical protein